MIHPRSCGKYITHVNVIPCPEETLHAPTPKSTILTFIEVIIWTFSSLTSVSDRGGFVAATDVESCLCMIDSTSSMSIKIFLGLISIDNCDQAVGFELFGVTWSYLYEWRCTSDEHSPVPAESGAQFASSASQESDLWQTDDEKHRGFLPLPKKPYRDVCHSDRYGKSCRSNGWRADSLNDWDRRRQCVEEFLIRKSDNQHLMSRPWEFSRQHACWFCGPFKRRWTRTRFLLTEHFRPATRSSIYRNQASASLDIGLPRHRRAEWGDSHRGSIGRDPPLQGENWWRLENSWIGALQMTVK